MKKLFAVGLVWTMAMIVASGAQAGPCVANDAWTGPDKVKHLAVGAAAGAAGTLVFKDARVGTLVGAGIGLAKEAWDKRQANHTCSLQDFAVTTLGAAAGAYGTAWLILPQKGGGVFVGYAKAL